MPARYPYFYHFTDARNVGSIEALGLLSAGQLELRRIAYHQVSNVQSRQIDQAKGLEDYVRLCLQPHHPMAHVVLKRLPRVRLAWLRIKPNPQNWSATKYRNCNAAASHAQVDSTPSTALESKDPQAEVLVRDGLAPKWILAYDIDVVEEMRLFGG